MHNKLLRIFTTKGIGNAKFWQLIKKFNSLDKIIDYLENSGKTVPKDFEIENYIKQYKKRNIKMLAYFDEKFPDSLKNISNAPAFFYYIGNIDFLKKDILAIVGARSASSNMIYFTKKFASQLNNFAIVSGLAYGIDTAAHKGSKYTIAVMAGGLDQVYPLSNQELFDDISKNGLIISEMPLGCKPTPYLFPRRNRIIAGIAKGIVVIEAAYQSGSLITAQYGAEYGKDIFVVPGSPLDIRSRGGNKLIKDGAYLVESAFDVLMHYKKQLKDDNPYKFKKQSSVQNTCDLKQKIIDSLSFEFLEKERLCIDFHIKSEKLNLILTELEIDGIIVKDPKGRISLKA